MTRIKIAPNLNLVLLPTRVSNSHALNRNLFFGAEQLIEQDVTGDLIAYVGGESGLSRSSSGGIKKGKRKLDEHKSCPGTDQNRQEQKFAKPTPRRGFPWGHLRRLNSQNCSGYRSEAEPAPNIEGLAGFWRQWRSGDGTGHRHQCARGSLARCRRVWKNRSRCVWLGLGVRDGEFKAANRTEVRFAGFPCTTSRTFLRLVSSGHLMSYSFLM